MKKSSLTTPHRIARAVLGILMIFVALSIGRMGMLFVLFGSLLGATASYMPGLLLIGTMLAVVLSAIAALFLMYKNPNTPNGSFETGLALINVVSGFVYLTAFPSSLDTNFSTTANTIGSYFYILSTLAIVWLLPKGFVRRLKAEPRTATAEVFRPSLGKIILMLALFVVGFLVFFMMAPLFMIFGSLFGMNLSGSSNDSTKFIMQMFIYAVIIAMCAIIGLLLVTILRKVRRSTPVSSDSHLLK